MVWEGGGVVEVMRVEMFAFKRFWLMQEIRIITRNALLGAVNG